MAPPPIRQANASCGRAVARRRGEWICAGTHEWPGTAFAPELFQGFVEEETIMTTRTLPIIAVLGAALALAALFPAIGSSGALP